MNSENFFRRHLWAGIGLLLGPAIAIGSLVLHAYALVELGLPVSVWVAIGLLIFFLSVIGIVYRQDQLVRQAHRPHAVEPLSSPPAGQATVRPLERIFVDVTPEYLKGLTNHEMMAVERERIVKPFIGKYMKLTVDVDDVHVRDHGGTIWVNGTEFRFLFGKKWKDRLEVLTRGQTITVTGKIDAISPRGLEFSDCDLA